MTPRNYGRSPYPGQQVKNGLKTCRLPGKLVGASQRQLSGLQSDWAGGPRDDLVKIQMQKQATVALGRRQGSRL